MYIGALTILPLQVWPYPFFPLFLLHPSLFPTPTTEVCVCAGELYESCATEMGALQQQKRPLLGVCLSLWCKGHLLAKPNQKE